MFIKDNFIHSTYSNPVLRKKRVSIRKIDICSFEETQEGSVIQSVEAELPIFITMPYDDVVKALQETVA